MKKTYFLVAFCITLSLCLVTNLFALVDPDLIIYLPMDDGNGDTVKDLSPNKLDGKITGKDYKWIDAHRNKGLEFTSGTHIQVPDNDLLDGMKALTIEIWAKQDTQQNTNLVLKGTNWPGLSYLLQPWSDGQIYWGINKVDSRAIAPAGSFDLKKWYHIASVFSGEELILYIDSVEKSRAKSPVNIVPETIEPLEVGKLFTGVVDEFAMYRRALKPAEIISDMEGITMAVNSKTGLTATWGKIKVIP
jgi:hypothetical protein